MPRPKSEGGSEPKKRSRTGCWPCKARKVKCGEEKPQCTNCVKNREACDYSIRLNWGGRSRKDQDGAPTEPGSFTFVSTPTAPSHAKSHSGHEHVFSAQHIAAAPSARPHSSHATSLLTPQPTPNGDGPILDPQLRLQYQPLPVPPQDGFARPDHNQVSYQSPSFSDASAPTSAPFGQDFRWSPQHSAKRVKLDPGRSRPASQPATSFAMPQYPSQNEQPSAQNHYAPNSISNIVNNPPTPGSSINSGSPYPQHHKVPSSTQDAPDLRRLSVKSLLSDPEEFERPTFARAESHGYRTYGFDHGFADLDVPENNDYDALHSSKSPNLHRASRAVSVHSSSSGDGDAAQIAFEPGGYYAQPVPIRIHRSLEPLPPELLNNPMNLLYFHHFINHTGRILVPHDCPENPFRTVLPRIAVRNKELLHLFLAFSASHRARLLHHPEPSTRIARWMEDVLPALLKALSSPPAPDQPTDPADPSSLAPLATAIMLASLEIVSPDTFAVSIPWQQHLLTARRMIVAKGGLDHLAQKADGARDRAIFFLSRWFAYLDVFGALSGGQQAQPLDGAYLEDGGGLWLVNRGDEEVWQIDCFFGFSGRCISLLAQVAELAAQGDKQRIDCVAKEIREDWRPSETMRKQAEELEKRVRASATMVSRGCAHQSPLTPQSPESSKTDTVIDEIFATNEAYHWAGLIHLYRRVLALPSDSPQVHDNVHKILDCLAKVRRGSSAESCLLFPMFIAGVEAQNEEERKVVMERLKAVEGWGMHQVVRARELMERCWSEGRAWEVLVDGEFFG